MAKRFNNEKGFLIIEMSVDEAINTCHFGMITGNGAYLIDDRSNQEISETEPAYYVAVLNCVLSKSSVKDFIANSIRYKENEKYEKQHFEHYRKLLEFN